ncbi:MAG: DUF1827 family protein [Streptococcaceae bacterium]|jgi:tRNA(Met) C34 N-acetyltransferase TmcA|nr:DUF1827 family protein [Streptococcaceae bacterium]
MKLINVTSNHPSLVLDQLESTDAQLVEVYSLGNTVVIYTEAPLHNEIVLTNKRRNISDNELKIVKKFFKRKMKNFIYNEKDIIISQTNGLVEISIFHKNE